MEDKTQNIVNIETLNAKIAEESKKLKDEINKKSIPSGTISFFQDSCPSGWQDMSSEYAGRYVRVAGTYNICDKQGENANGDCIETTTETTLTAGTKQGESNRRITGTLPGQDADVSKYTNYWSHGASNYRDGYVVILKRLGFLSGAFDYVKTSELPGQKNDANYNIPTNWSTFKWPLYEKPSMYRTDNNYVYFIDPNVLSLSDTSSTSSGQFFLNSIDTKRVLPTDTINDETRPKTIILKACRYK